MATTRGMVYIETSVVSYLRMSDEIIKELWEIKDGIAREHEYDVDRLVANLRARKRPAGQQVVDLRSARRVANQAALPEDHNKCR